MGFKIKYKTLMISVIIFFSTIFVIDRFTYNVWPLYFTKDSPIEDDWTATTFFIIGWIAGRELIVSSSFIWLLQCRCLWNWVFEHKPNWLIVDDIMIENNHMHYHLGWAAIAVPMVVHTWLVFLPLLQGVPMTIYPTWYRPIDHELDPDFFVETYHHHHLNISINDIFALVMLTITFLALFPISMSKKVRGKHWSIAQYTHQLAAFLYGVELLRTPLTAHCWFISTPFILCYIIDRALATFYYRFTDKARVVAQYNFDDKYILLCLWVPDIYYHLVENDEGIPREIGDVFWLNTKGFVYRKIPQPAHPFTSFYNHNNAIPNIQNFLQSQEERKDLAHPSHKFPISKRKNRDEAVHHEDVTHNKDISYQLGRAPTVDSTAAGNLDKLKDQISLTENDALAMSATMGHASIAEDAEEDEFGDGAEETLTVNAQLDTEKVSNIPNLKEIKNTESVFIHNQIELNQLKQQDTLTRGETLKSWQWNVGFIIRVHERDDKYGFTQRIAKRKAIKNEDDENHMMSYGPYRSSFANIIPFMEGTDGDDDNDGAIILIATGAGASYMIDTVLYLRGKYKSNKDFKLKREVRIHFSCRSIRLFQWITNFLCAEKLPNVSIFANLTSHKNIHDYDDGNDDADDGDIDNDGFSLKKNRKSSNAKIGRASFKDVLKQSPHKSLVFFCGHPRIQGNIKEICKDLHFTFYEGHSFG